MNAADFAVSSGSPIEIWDCTHVKGTFPAAASFLGTGQRAQEIGAVCCAYCSWLGSIIWHGILTPEGVSGFSRVGGVSTSELGGY